MIRLSDGFGNQLFQYALYLTLKHRGRKVCVDDYSRYGPGSTRKPVLKSWLGLSYERAAEEELKALPVYEEKSLQYDPEVLLLDRGYLQGYWQTEKYFPDPEVQELLRRSIGDPETYHGSESFRKWFRYIQETESVSVHLRGGDYLIGNNKEVYGGICTPRYYHKAVEYIRQSAPEAKFFLFTNDKAYARLQYGRWTSFVIVEDRELSDLDEFILMRSCRHHILANSSFSWWAAWLDSRAQAKVIAPFPWLRKRDIRDIYTEQMHKIRGRGIFRGETASKLS